jgi:hypothetical protein
LPNAQKKLSGAYGDTDVCIGGGAEKTDPKTLYGLT